MRWHKSGDKLAFVFGYRTKLDTTDGTWENQGKLRMALDPGVAISVDLKDLVGT